MSASQIATTGGRDSSYVRPHAVSVVKLVEWVAWVSALVRSSRLGLGALISSGALHCRNAKYAWCVMRGCLKALVSAEQKSGELPHVVSTGHGGVARLLVRRPALWPSKFCSRGVSSQPAQFNLMKRA